MNTWRWRLTEAVGPTNILAPALYSDVEEAPVPPLLPRGLVQPVVGGKGELPSLTPVLPYLPHLPQHIRQAHQVPCQHALQGVGLGVEVEDVEEGVEDVEKVKVV